MSNAITVVGGGLVGMCTALSLQRNDFSVTVCAAASETPPPSWGHAGRLAVELAEPLASYANLWSLPRTLFFRGGPVALPAMAIPTWLPFGLSLMRASSPRRLEKGRESLKSLLEEAIPAWRRCLEDIGGSPLLVENGHYSIWENLASSRRALEAWRTDSGCARTHTVGLQEMARLRSLVRVPLVDALKFSGTASIADPSELRQKLVKVFVERGGQLRGQTTDLQSALQSADHVVVAAGVGSKTLLKSLGHRVPLIAERGYHIQENNPSWPQDLPPIFFEDRSVVVTRFTSSLRMTSFAEFTRDDAPPDPRKWDRLRFHARDLGLPFSETASQWMGSRPTLPDYLPAIGKSRRHPRVYYAFGHQHLGLTLAAVTGELVVNLLKGRAPAQDLANFDIDRFE